MPRADPILRPPGALRRAPGGATNPEALRRPVQTLRHSLHDEGLDSWPVVYHLVVADTNDVIAAEHEFGVVPDVRRALCADMRPAVGLQHEAVADEEVHRWP